MSYKGCPIFAESIVNANNYIVQVTDSHSVDVEALRKKSLETGSVRGSSASSVVSLSDVVHPTMASVTTSPRHKASNSSEQFENGDVLVTLLPVNEKFPWVTPAKFRPELVPEELMAPSLSVSKIFQLILEKYFSPF